jgi:hypothetical protein
MSTHAPRAVPALDTAHDPSTSPVMAMLSDHLPLTLLLDLALGVRSSEVYVAETPDLSWLSSGAVSRAG